MSDSKNNLDIEPIKFYGKTKEEQFIERMRINRNVVKNLMTMGMTQKQILHLIKLLALELESHSQMREICDVVNEFLGEDQEKTIIY